MPPAFNLSQDQTLQFKPSPIAEATDFFLAQQTLRHRSACRYLFGIIQTTPEHPHKLSDDPIVKDLISLSASPNFRSAKTDNFTGPEELVNPSSCPPSLPPLTSLPAQPLQDHYASGFPSASRAFYPNRIDCQDPFDLFDASHPRRPVAHQPAVSRIRAMRRLPTW